MGPSQTHDCEGSNTNSDEILDEELIVDNQDIVQYEVDGWHVGYEVQINGIGGVETSFERVEQPNGNEETEDSSDWESDAPSDVCEQETDPSTMDALELRYAGYRTLPTDPSNAVTLDTSIGDIIVPKPSTSDSEEEQVDREKANVQSNTVRSTLSLADDCSAEVTSCTIDRIASLSGPSVVSSSVRAEFEKLLNEKRPSVIDEPLLDCTSKEISLDDSKISLIRNAMSSFTLQPPPQWKEDELINDDITEIMKNIMRKN